MSIAEIIAGCSRKLAVECSLDELMLLGHFTARMDERLIRKLIKSYSAKEIICADYAGCAEADFCGQDIIYACCRRLVQKGSVCEKAVNSTTKPAVHDYLAAEAYRNSLSTDFSKSLSQKAENIDELKAVILVDEAHARYGFLKADYRLPPQELALEMARELCSRKKPYPGEENWRLNEIIYGNSASRWRRIAWKKWLTVGAIVTAFGIVGFKAERCYNDWKKADAAQYAENRKKMAVCESYLASGDYRIASVCTEELMQGIDDAGWFSQSKKLAGKVECLEQRIEQKLDKHYTAKLGEVRKEIRRGNYETALEMNAGIIAEIEAADYYNNSAPKIKEAKELEKIIEKKIEESGREADDARGIFETAYNGVKRLYMWLGLGETASATATIATLLLPVSFAVRRLFRRIRG